MLIRPQGIVSVFNSLAVAVHFSANIKMDVPNGNDILGKRNLSPENIAVNKRFTNFDGILTSVPHSLPLIFFWLLIAAITGNNNILK